MRRLVLGTQGRSVSFFVTVQWYLVFGFSQNFLAVTSNLQFLTITVTCICSLGLGTTALCVRRVPVGGRMKLIS